MLTRLDDKVDGDDEHDFSADGGYNLTCGMWQGNEQAIRSKHFRSGVEARLSLKQTMITVLLYHQETPFWYLFIILFLLYPVSCKYMVTESSRISPLLLHLQLR